MTQIYLEEKKKEESPQVRKNKIIRYLKFYLIPGWRDPGFTAHEYEIGKIKSKRRFFRRLLTPLTIAGMVMILFIAFWAVYAPILTQYTIEELSLGGGIPTYAPPFADPSPENPLGTTKYGFDVLGRLIWGARTALTAAAVPVIISLGGGIILGSISAYFGGVVDSVIMRIVDIMYSFPMLILVIILAPMVGRDLYNILGIYGILFIPYSTRFVRSLVLQVKQNVYVRAAVTSGAEKFKVMFKHIFPNTLSPIIISFFGSMAGAILGFASLAFLGLADEQITDWGTDILYARDHSLAYWAVLWPGLLIAITAIGFMLIGDGLRDALDPRLHI